MLIPGQMFNNRYMIMQEIAEGGQSIVYMAQDRSAFDRLVAVKEFKMNSVALVDLHAAIDQFEKTASLLAHLNHPNIAQIYEYVTLGNVPYLVTEFVNGNTLEQHLRASPNGLPEDQVKQWGAQLCDVLAYLHSQTPPIIFRDLKPDNIMLAPTGMLKLIDFGIARTFKLGRAADTELLGTPGYSPPEQYGRGQTGPYSDVYALGATLLRVATGYDPSLTPFQLPHADKVRSEISRSFSEALASSTDLDYRKRFPTMRAFRQALVSPAKPARAPNLPLAAGVLSVVALVALIVAALATTGLLSGLSPAPAVVASSPTVTATELAAEATATPAPTFTPGYTDTPAPTDTPAATNTPDSAATLAAERTKIAGDLYGTATAEAATSKPPATTPPQPVTEGPTSTKAPAGPSATPAPAVTTTDAKAMFSFEKPFTWQRGDQPYGEMSFSTEQAHDGQGSAKITYNYPSVQDDFVVFRNGAALSAQATGMAAWVYGDGSGHFLNIWVEDSAGEVRQFSFGRIYHNGWRSMVAWFDVTLPWPQTHISGQDKAALQPPYKFYALVLDRVSGSNTGTIYVDEMNVTTQQPPAHATTPQPADTTAPAENTPAATNTPPPPPSSLTVCNPSMKGVSNMCVGNNPVPQGGSTHAIWRIETTFKEGCFDSGDGRGCVGPITSQMRVELTDISSPRTITLSWTDDELKHYTDSLTIQVSQ